MSFPVTRPRRLRRSEAIRSLARETRLSAHGFIYPMFVCPGRNVRNPIASMPGVAQQSVDTFLEECREVEQLGIPGIILFGIPEKKDALGTEAYAADGVVQRAIEAVRRANLYAGLSTTGVGTQKSFYDRARFDAEWATRS